MRFLKAKFECMFIAMSIANATLDIPKNPAERRAWVGYRLRVQGMTLTELAAKEGVSRQAISNALMMPSASLELAIARELGVQVERLFPERFDAAGKRLTHTRPTQRNTGRGARNVQKDMHP